MTLAGTFHNQDFSQALSSVKAQTGILALKNLASEARMCLHLSNARVQAVFVNGRPLRCSDEARRLLLRQFSEPASSIQFEQALPEDLRKGLDISLEGLLADAPEPCTGASTGLLQRMRQRFARVTSPS
ncbi:hypothetical protein GCM10017783_19720 [Deinococcus piscis]|uniref:DUF4388 domain-containing protein n=1 Tax=Deinococcus piscis TaxID=394230 RepID=A0ABQ3KC90_9DEIO|nr:hypothetical protein [Deinococcus piscis]GHG07225.1 hypothetical protein GCM10017783_19720 [Deinococcus piscis]